MIGNSAGSLDFDSFGSTEVSAETAAKTAASLEAEEQRRQRRLAQLMSRQAHDAAGPAAPQLSGSLELNVAATPMPQPLPAGSSTLPTIQMSEAAIEALVLRVVDKKLQEQNRKETEQIQLILPRAPRKVEIEYSGKYAGMKASMQALHVTVADDNIAVLTANTCTLTVPPGTQGNLLVDAAAYPVGYAGGSVALGEYTLTVFIRIELDENTSQ